MGLALVDLRQSGTAAGADVRETELGPGAIAPSSPPSPVERGSRARVIGAALRCIGRFGVSKTTVDDIAREAGLSRATLYRAFPGGRDEVFCATAEAEIARYFEELRCRLEETEELEELLVVFLTAGADLIARHDALRFLLAHEPEVIVPHLSFGGFAELLAVAASFLQPYLEPSLGRTEGRRVAEWVTRLVTSHVVCPPGAVQRTLTFGAASRASNGRDAPFALHPEPIAEERARRLVHQFVMPGIHVLRSNEHSGTGQVDECQQIATSNRRVEREQGSLR